MTGPPESQGAEFTPTLRSALDFLRSRARFSAEVRVHLAGRGFDAEAVESVVRHLLDRKLIDDAKTAAAVIKGHSGKRAMGIQRMREELRRLGASEDTIDTGLAAIVSSQTEWALDALRAKYKSGADRGKAGRFLISRGFDEDAVESALDVFCGSSDD